MFLEIKLVGGLGNQLFQYAAGRSLCIKKNIHFLLLNTDSFTKQPLGRTYTLGKLQIKGTVIRTTFIKKIFRQHTKLNKIFSYVGVLKNIKEDGLYLQQIDNHSRFLISLEGYWQSAWYFNNIRDILLKEFRPKQIPQLPEWMKDNTTVAVHIRRTDYLAENRYGFIGEGYYRKSIDFIRKKIKNPLFVFFSDDIAWCKFVFNDPNFLFCEDIVWNKDYLQLYLMSKCTHQITANSTFSWWGAWLNENPEKIVLRPAEPFKEKSLQYESHYPQEWIAVNNFL